MRRLTNVEFIEMCNKVHNNKFNYSKTIFKNVRSKIIIICPNHGDIEIKASNHLHMKQGCDKCARDNHRLTELSSERIKNLKKIHNNKYLYNDISINRGFINITCDYHGVFKQYLYYHEYGHGCPECNSSSRGEDAIKSYLENNSINFIRNYQFDDCIRIRKLRFDFYLPDINICIEYDGEHHYQENKYFGEGNLDYINKNDQIKNKYCINNKINLIRIPYWDLDNIQNILEKNL
jgi:hypothetical protein